MDYALDRITGEIILPIRALSHKHYLCPCCKKEVTVRGVGKLSQRVRHFAHLKGRADKNCENFFESTGMSLVSTKFFNPIIPGIRELQSKIIIEDKFSSGLYLKVNGNGWFLYFQFQFNGRQNTGRQKFWGGQLIIQGSEGVRYFNADDIEGRHEVQVDFNFSKKSISFNGNVDHEIWNKFSSDVPMISGEMDFFHAPYSTGKLMRVDESLRLGENYIIATRSSLNEINEISNFIEKVNRIEDINYFQLILPHSIIPSTKDLLENFFRRNISEVRPSFKLLDPLPEYIEIDGTVHVPLSTNLIALSFDCNESEIDFRLLEDEEDGY
jgi:hypothetical protein